MIKYKYINEYSPLITSWGFTSLLSTTVFVKQALGLEYIEGHKLFMERKIKYLYKYGGFLIVKFDVEFSC